MKNPVASIKTLVLLSTIAFAGHVLATQDPWFSGTAEGDTLTYFAAEWDTNVVGEVTVAASALSIDLPTNTVVKLTPTSSESNKKTYVVVDGAVFTPTAYEDIDNSVVEGAQTALTVAYDANNATNYYAYITNNWVKLSGADPVETPVDVTIVLDYSDAAQTNVSFTVGTTELQDDFGNKQFPIATASERSLSRVELAGYGQIHSITSTVEAVANVTVTPGTVTYGADFTNVTITATLGGTGYESAEYSLTWNGTSVAGAVATVSGDTLTITAPINHPAAGRAPVTYAINVNGTTGEPQNTVVADENEWVNENANTTRQTAAGGNWSNEVTYAESVADISDNTFTAERETAGDQVKITFKDLTYAELCDLSVETPGGTQGAFAIAEENNVKSFYILAMENDRYTWKATTCAVTANTNIAYTVVMTFNYVNNTYSVSVSDGTNVGDLSVGSNAAFPLCVSKTSVKDFVFKGSGKLEAIKGVDSLGYMAKDGAGHWYATIDEAAGSGGREFIVLRPTGPAPSGWKFDTKDGITKLVKVAKGMFFMAY